MSETTTTTVVGAEPTPTPTPGLYAGVPYADYERIRAINWSVLRRFRRSAAHARAEATSPPEPSEELDFGHAFHTFVLEPESFGREYVAVPEDAPGRRSKVDKEWWRQFEEENKGRSPLRAPEMEQMVAMRAGLYRNPDVRTLLEDPRAMREVTLVWLDPDTGLLCKGRIDILSRALGATVIGDLKTVVDASDFGFRSAIPRYGWGGQIMFYLDGLQTLAPMPSGSSRTPAFVPVEKEPPYCARLLVYEIASQEASRAQWRRFLRLYKNAVERDEWPGYPNGEIGLPAYAMNE